MQFSSSWYPAILDLVSDIPLYHYDRNEMGHVGTAGQHPAVYDGSTNACIKELVLTAL